MRNVSDDSHYIVATVRLLSDMLSTFSKMMTRLNDREDYVLHIKILSCT